MIMKKPEIDVIRFSGSDVVAASGLKTLTISGMGNAAANDNTFEFGEYTYTNMTSNKIEPMTNDMSSYFDANITKSTNVINENNKSAVLNTLGTGGTSATDGFNGIYVYENGSFVFLKKK